MFAIYALSFGISWHGQLKRKIGGISQKMLAQTLRALERDDIVNLPLHLPFRTARGKRVLAAARVNTCDHFRCK